MMGRQHTNHETAGTRRFGFTIIELLMVIAIIGLLIGMLMPALQAARTSTNRVACQNNLRQIALGVFMYCDAHDGHFPITAAHELGGPTGRVRMDDPWLPAQMFGGGLPSEQRVINPYVDQGKEIFRCPADQGEPLWWFDTESYQKDATAYELYGSSYFYASGHNRMIGVIMPMGLAKVVGLDFSYERFQKNPLPNGRSLKNSFFLQSSKKVLVGDIPLHRTMSGVVAPNPRAQWHQKDAVGLWANVAFLDGHVEFVRVFPYDSPHPGVYTTPSADNPYY